MLFNSFTYFIFLIIVLSAYVLLHHKWQNRMLLVASYVFYGWWDWRFLTLIFLSTVTDYVCGEKIYQSKSASSKRRFVIVSICINLGLLGFFKYFNFFTESLATALESIGLNGSIGALHIILPVGISFYTFQTMTYSIDIYRGKLKPTNDFLDYALFVSFFPQLVAGPIERAQKLLPQIQNKRHCNLESVIRGGHLIFLGLFKKVFVADNLAIIVDRIYSNPSSTGFEYVVGTWAFAFQIYGDFSGYTDIARGTAKCFGIDLMENFRQPYFAINPSDLWRRWHISLSTWFRDYLYIPLGGNRKGRLNTYKNIFITMFLCGLWHGAAWNFVIWGIFHACLLIGYRVLVRNNLSGKYYSQSVFHYGIRALVMFQLTCIGWVFFRSQNIEQVGVIFTKMLFEFNFGTDSLETLQKVLFFCSFPLFIMGYKTLLEIKPSWVSRSRILYREFVNIPFHLKGLIYGVLTYLLCFYGASAQSFIYFQF